MYLSERKSFWMPEIIFFSHSLYNLASGNSIFLWKQEHLVLQKEEKDQHGF